jgi:hypothetical protein
LSVLGYFLSLQEMNCLISSKNKTESWTKPQLIVPNYFTLKFRFMWIKFSYPSLFYYPS